MEDNSQKGWQPQQPANLPMSENKPTSLPPPPPEIVLRTMKSDLESLKETGGSTVSPKPFTPPEISALGGSASGGKKEWNPPAPPPPPPPPKITPSEFGAPKKTEEKIMATASSVIEDESLKPGKTKKILLWVGILLIVIAIIAVVVFVVAPYLFPQEETPPPPAITPPAAETPTELPPIELPPAEQPPVLLPHQSLFNSSDPASQINLVILDLASFKNALSQEAANLLPTGNLKEVFVSDAGGQVPTSSILPALLPELMSGAVKNTFEEDFTTALYYDADGVWPVYVFKLSLNSSIVEAQNTMKSLELSQNLSNLYLSSPGTPNPAGFKDGTNNARYLTFSKKGASLNLTWLNDKFIISTSYNGLKKALANL